MRCIVLTLVLSLGIGCAARTVPVASEAAAEGLRVTETTAARAPLDANALQGTAAPVALRAVPSRTTLQTAEQWDAALAAALARLDESAATERLLDVAEAYRRVGIGDKAADYYARALLADPKSAAAYDGLARVWRDGGFPDIGLAEAYRAVYYAPASPEAQNTLGTLLQALGSTGPARERYERAVALDAGAAYALANLCGLELTEGKPERAAAACEQALAIDAGLDVARRNLARAEAMIARARLEDPNARH